MARRTPFNMLSSPPKLAKVAPTRTALLLLDFECAMIDRDGGFAHAMAERAITREFDEYYEMAEAATRGAARLLAAARRTGVQVVHSVLIDRGPSTLSRQLQTMRLPLPTGDPVAALRAEVRPRSGERVLPRGTFSPFLDTDLTVGFRSDDIERVVIAGMLANVTVALAAREAADRGFSVVVAQDASASETFDWHTVTMLGLLGGAIRVQWVEEIIELFEGTRT